MNDEPKTDHDRIVAIYTMMVEVVLPTLKKQNGRIGSLEKFRWVASGVILTVVFYLTGKIVW